MDKPIDKILSLLNVPRKTTCGWNSRCPAHDDKQPSLSISEGREGRVLLYCHAGCQIEDIVAALNLGMSDLFAQK